MCVACIEFIKGTLTTQEFKSALRESTRDDQNHFNEVEVAISSGSVAADNGEALRKKLKDMPANSA
jgi:hypothetical protein